MRLYDYVPFQKLQVKVLQEGWSGPLAPLQQLGQRRSRILHVPGVPSPQVMRAVQLKVRNADRFEHRPKCLQGTCTCAVREELLAQAFFANEGAQDVPE